MCSGSGAGSYLRLIDLCMRHSLGDSNQELERVMNELELQVVEARGGINKQVMMPSTHRQVMMPSTDRLRGHEQTGAAPPNSHGARSVRLIITMIKWTRTSRLTMKKSLSGAGGDEDGAGVDRRRQVPPGE